MEFKPLHDNILVDPIKIDNKFGIEGDELSFRATVISCGEYVTHIYPGDIVYLSKYAGTKYNDMFIVTPMDILGKDK